MDIGILGGPPVYPDIANKDLAEAAGYHLEELVKNKDRSSAVKVMQEGGVIVAHRLLQEGKLHGVIGLGGGTGTAMVTHIMRSLPFGLPKLVVSTVASRDVREFVETKDIVMFHSVADLLGLNGFMRHILGQAAHAVCAMMDKGSAITKERPMIAVTAYGINSQPAVFAEPLLWEKGYEMIAFHANGCGGMAMEELIAQGLIKGVFDLTPHEIVGQMFEGFCKGIGPSRFETAGQMGVPLVFAPGGLDNAAYSSPSHPMPEEFAGRRIYIHDA
jgi:uncharacterized protein (UPF0261 family)